MNRFFVAGLISSALVAGLAHSGKADVIYSLRHTERGEKLSSRPQTRVLASNQARLEEVWNPRIGIVLEAGRMANTGAPYIKTLRLTQYAQKRVFVMDAGRKTYRIESFTPEEDPRTSFEIADLGEVEILGWKTWHFRIDATYSHTPLDKSKARVEIWVVPAAQIKDFPALSPNFPWVSRQMVSGDVGNWDIIQNGLILRRTVWNLSADEPQKAEELFSEEVTSLCFGKIDEALFAIPDGYKEVSREEFSRSRRERDAKP